MYIDNPDLCSANGDPNCYFGKVGVAMWMSITRVATPARFAPVTRWGMPRREITCGQTSTLPTGLIIVLIHSRQPIYTGAEWVNYTRDWPKSTNRVIARLATDIGLSGSQALSQINPGVSTNVFGTFTIIGGIGWSTFEYVYLKDTNGNNNVNIVLNGQETLQVTSGGNLLPNFFMLVAAQLDLPLLSDLYPTGTRRSNLPTP